MGSATMGRTTGIWRDAERLARCCHRELRQESARNTSALSIAISYARCAAADTCHAVRMRTWVAIALCIGCGPIGPASAPPPPAPEALSPDEVPAPDPALASPASRTRGAAPRAPAGRSSDKPGTSSEAQQLVDAHNRVRAKHCARPLAWSPKLAEVAQQWANSLRDRGCVFGHSGGDYGENL